MLLELSIEMRHLKHAHGTRYTEHVFMCVLMNEPEFFFRTHRNQFIDLTIVGYA